jgi:hypothetical protein
VHPVGAVQLAVAVRLPRRRDELEYIASTYSRVTSSSVSIALSLASLRAMRNFSRRFSVAPEMNDSWI